MLKRIASDLMLRGSVFGGLILGLAGMAIMSAMTAAQAQYIGRVQDIGDLRLGQRVLVDDGTCPAGQVKEVSGAKMSAIGVVRTSRCIPRFGAQKR
jgi:hypothetical protein